MIPETELILNPDGSIYHLKLKPGDIGNYILFVGDPDRVPLISARFDKIELRIQNRELVTHTGYIGTHRVSCISTGMGTDNIDIVMNELDALVNIDFETRNVKSNLTKLNIIRLGTSGSLQKEIEVDNILVSRFALGLDSLMQFYSYPYNEAEKNTDALLQEFSRKTGLPLPYFVSGSEKLLGLFKELAGEITVTCPGFYAPQGREIRAKINPKAEKIIHHLKDLYIYMNGIQMRATNLEMETAGIYGMAGVMGHEAISINAILGNRITQKFSQNPAQTIDKMIDLVLGKLFA